MARSLWITTSELIEGVRQRIVKRVREVEEELSDVSPTPSRLEGYAVTDAYIPPPRERRIYAYGSTKEIRQTHIRIVRAFQRECRKCYELAKQGVKNIPWPRECFIPPLPKLCNVW